MRRSGFHNQSLKLEPFQLLFSEACFLSLLSLFVLEEKHTNEEIQEEETSDKDEENEVDHLSWLVVELRAVVFLGDIQCLVHDVRPAFKR